MTLIKNNTMILWDIMILDSRDLSHIMYFGDFGPIFGPKMKKYFFQRTITFSKIDIFARSFCLLNSSLSEDIENAQTCCLTPSELGDR